MMRKTMLVLVCFALVACGTEMMSQVMDDAGHALVDAANVIDGGDDAAAQDMPRVIEQTCDGMGVVTTTAASGALVQSTTYYASIMDVAISDSMPNISAIVCERMVVTSDPEMQPCPTGSHCTDTRPTHFACTTVPVEFDNGRARVSCGSSTRTDADGSGSGVAQESGVRYMTARFTIR